MANAKAQVTVYIDSNDPVVVARMQELVTENELFRRALEWYANASDYDLCDSQFRARWALESRDWDAPAATPAAEQSESGVR